MEGKSIGLTMIGVGLLLILVSFVLGGGIAFSASSGLPEGDDGRKWQCTGTVDVAVFGAETLTGVQCLPQKCGFFDRRLAFIPVFPFTDFGLTATEGSVALIVDNTIADAKSWDSSFGRNQEFGLKSACVRSSTNPKVVLYDDEGAAIDTFEQVTQ